MSQQRKNQSGIVVLELLLILLGLALIGFVGYRVYDARKAADKQFDQSTSQSVPVEDSNTPEIKNATDLNEAEQSLNQINPDDSDSDASQLDSQIDSF